MRVWSSLRSALLFLELPFLMACAGLGLFNRSALILSVIFIPIFWLLHEREDRKTSLDAPVLIILLTFAISYWVSPLPDWTAEQIARALSGIGVCYALAHQKKSFDGRLILYGMAVLSVILAGAGLLTIQWVPNKIPMLNPMEWVGNLPRLDEVVHPNVFAGNLALLLPVSGALFLWGKGWLHVIRAPLALLTGGLVLFVLILTLSRGALLAAISSLLLLLILRWKFPAFIVLVLLGLILWQAFPAIETFIKPIYWFSSAEASLNLRQSLWQRGLWLVEMFPLSGIGMGTYGLAVNHLFPMPSPLIPTSHAHNLFIQIALDTGIPGLLAWLACLWQCIQCAWRAWRAPSTVPWWIPASGAAGLAAFWVLLFHGATDAVTWGTRPALLLWVIWGWMLLLKKKIAEPSPSA
ncbi:MAG: O-antigen ligase family protein [Anaerolinea sp.]